MPAALVEGQSELLDCRDDDLVRVVVGPEAADKRCGVGILLDAVLLEPVELLAGLTVEILAVDDEKALVDAPVGLEKRRGLERSERLARAGRVPDVAIAAVLIDAVDNRLDRVDLVRGASSGAFGSLAMRTMYLLIIWPKRALGEEPIGEIVEVSDIRIVPGREPVDRKESLVRVEGEMPRLVVGEVIRIRAVADNEKLDEAEERPGISVARVIPVADDLLHRPPGADPGRLQFDLNHRDAVDQEHDIVAVMAVVGIECGTD